MKEKKVVQHFPLPYLGHRIIKTSLAVFLCLVIHRLLGFEGVALQSAIAAIVCMQPQIEDTKKYAFDRIVGTVIGAAWGLFFLLVVGLFPGLPKYMMLVYLLMSLGVLVTIYSTVILKLTDTAGLSAIVFLSVVVVYPMVEAPLRLAGSRILDTTVGILIAIAVNVIHLPRKKREDCLFFVRLQDLVPDRYARVDSGVMTFLNRLYQDGAKICLVSTWAPAFVLSQMELLETGVPAIVMDGAALYDFREKKYIKIMEMNRDDAAFLCRTLKDMDLGYCVYAVRDTTTLIYRQGHLNQAEEQEYRIMRRSLLRNYVDGFYTPEDQVAFIRTIDTEERIDQLEKKVKEVLPEGRYRIEKRKQPKYKGYAGLYFYAADATVNNMKEWMLTHDGNVCRGMDILPAKGHYDVKRDAIHLLHKVYTLYEPLIFLK